MSNILPARKIELTLFDQAKEAFGGGISGHVCSTTKIYTRHATKADTRPQDPFVI
jgi:hypothetical protein